MPVVQVDYQLRYPYAENPDGYYYWTQSVYLVAETPLDFPSYIFRVQQPMSQGMMNTVKFNRLLVRMPPHSDTVLENAFAFNVGGNITPGDTILENIMRVHFFIGEQYASYKLLRGCVATSEIMPDGTIDPVKVAYVQAYYADAAITNQWTNDQGVAFTSAIVQPTIHHWQLRHGTKRRQRVVIAP